MEQVLTLPAFEHHHGRNELGSDRVMAKLKRGYAAAMELPVELASLQTSFVTA